MTIQIIEEDEKDHLRLTRAELERYTREWRDATRYTTLPVSLETYIRQQLDYKRYDV